MPRHDCLKLHLEPKGEQTDLRTKLMKSAGFESIQKLLQEGRPVGDEAELEVLETLQQLMRRHLHSYDDIDFEEDAIVLESKAPKVSYRKLMAIVVRHGEMKVLQSTMDALQHMIRDL